MGLSSKGRWQTLTDMIAEQSRATPPYYRSPLLDFRMVARQMPLTIVLHREADTGQSRRDF
jgi:hypothetical protein